MLTKTVLFIFLGANALIDIRKKRISLATLILICLYALILLVLHHEDFPDHILGMAMFLIMLLMSLCSGGAVGMGDALVLLPLGLLLNTASYVVTLGLGFMLASAWSLWLLVVRKKNRHTEIAFVPFLLLGYLGGVWIE